MNSLHKYSAFGKKATVALMIISVLAIAAVAQRVAPQEQGKMYGDPGFVGEAVNLNVVNADVRDILRYITEQYGINFVIDKSVPAVPVTVNVSNVPWNVALDSVLQAQDLAVQVNGPILRIADSKKLSEEQEIIRKNQEGQLDVAPLYTEFIRLNYARAYGTLQGTAGQAGQTTSGTSGGGGGGAGSLATSGGVGGVGGVGGLGADQGILGIVKKRLSRRGGVEVDGRSNTLIITDVRENIDAIRQLVYLLDQPEPQVEIETRVVVATRNFSRDLGVQLSASIPGADGRIGFDTQAVGIGNAPNTLVSLTTGILGTSTISAFINLGEQKGQAKTIATPRVTTLNNRPAEIQSGLQIPINTIQPGSGGTDNSIVFTTEYVSVPLRLAVTPQITDVGTVILNVVAENSNVTAGGVASAPAISTQSMTTQVMVPDGGTTVVGGVLVDQESEDKSGTPGVSKIPILGWLFKRKSIRRDTNELLFFITPRIYRPDYNGNPTPGKVSNGPRSTTIIQPVPLGNPPSNSGEQPLPTPVRVTPVVPNNQPVGNPPR
jgi:type IV pilus assembly protein PilQ